LAWLLLINQAMSNPPLKIQIENPGFFVLPEEDAPVLQLLIKQNESGHISELTIRFHPSIQVKLQSHKSVRLRFRGTGDQIDVAVPGDCSWKEQTVKQAFQHLHVTPLDRSQIQKIQKLLQYVLAHSDGQPG
jgi:hypothetical protein